MLFIVTFDIKNECGNKMLNETYFKTFDMERISIDKVFFLIYDTEYSQIDHAFDHDLRDKFILNVKRSRVKKGRFEQVIRKEADFSSWELQIRGPRVMRFHVNVIHYLQEIHNIKPQNVIFDDNFLPVDSKLTLIDHVAALRDFVKYAKQMYIDIAAKYWGVVLGNVQVKFSEVELPFEVYPASVDDIAGMLYAKGVQFSRYNTQSGTLYLKQPTTDNEIKVSRKYDKVQKIDDVDIIPDTDIENTLAPDIVYWNNINSGRNENKIQIKIYQKTFGLCRIEFTFFSNDAKTLLNFDEDENGIQKTDLEIVEDLILFSHFNLKQYDIQVDRYDRTLDDVVRFMAVSMRESEDLIYMLRDCDVFEACEANAPVRKRLVRKGMLLKKHDSDGTHQRGVYLINPFIKDFLNLYKAKGNEHFVTSSLYPSL